MGRRLDSDLSRHRSPEIQCSIPCNNYCLATDWVFHSHEQGFNWPRRLGLFKASCFRKSYCHCSVKLTSDGEKALSFVLGVLLSLGIVFYVVYTAPGFALFPINLVKQIPTLQISDVDTARQEREHNRESQRRIEVRYQGTGQPMPAQDRRLLEALQREERTLTRRQRLAEESGNRRQWREKLVSALRPFKVAFGVILVLLSILIIVSMSLTLYPPHTRMLML